MSSLLAEDDIFMPASMPSLDVLGGLNPSFYPPDSTLEPPSLYGIPLQDEANAWSLVTMEALETPSWTSSADPSLPQMLSSSANGDRELDHCHMNNGQPTPPPLYDDAKLQSTYNPDYSLSPYYLGPSSEDMFQISTNDSVGEPQSSPAPSKSSTRGRRTTRQNPYQCRTRASTSSSLSTSFDGHGEGTRREKFLERNRVAASKCRRKKKMADEELVRKHDTALAEKQRLTRTVNELRGELLTLKNTVLKHSGCGDEAINLHLSRMVHTITQQDRAAAAATTTTTTTTAVVAVEAAHIAPGQNIINIPIDRPSTFEQGPNSMGFGFDGLESTFPMCG